jgi:hypothetical protein
MRLVALGNLRITYDKQDEHYRKNFVKISITVKQFSSWGNFIVVVWECQCL